MFKFFNSFSLYIDVFNNAYSDISTKKSINLNNHTYANILHIGIDQAFAIVPGVSPRSGAVISMALFFWME